MTLANWLRLHFGYQGDEQGAQGELARQQAKVDAQAAADASRKRRDLSQDYRQESELHLVNWLRKQHGYEGGQDGAAAASRRWRRRSAASTRASCSSPS